MSILYWWLSNNKSRGTSFVCRFKYTILRVTILLTKKNMHSEPDTLNKSYFFIHSNKWLNPLFQIGFSRGKTWYINLLHMVYWWNTLKENKRNKTQLCLRDCSCDWSHRGLWSMNWTTEATGSGLLNLCESVIGGGSCVRLGREVCTLPDKLTPVQHWTKSLSPEKESAVSCQGLMLIELGWAPTSIPYTASTTILKYLFYF